MSLPLNIDWQQILLHLFNFSILSLGLYLLLYNPVRNFIESRSEYYKQLDSEANEKIQKAKELELSLQERMNRIQAEMEEHRAKLLSEAQNEADEILLKARQNAQKIISDARKAALQEREKILEEAHKEAASIAISAMEKMLSESSDVALDQFLEVVKKE